MRADLAEAAGTTPVAELEAKIAALEARILALETESVTYGIAVRTAPPENAASILRAAADQLPNQPPGPAA
jgi:hypothetical protein